MTTSSPSRPPLGFIGLGIMGSAMAGHLLKAGYPLTVWNRTAAKAAPLAAAGASVAASPADVARTRPFAICLNVTDSPDVQAVIFGPQGILAGASPGLIIIDHSTISPQATIDFSQRLARHQITFIDAPVSGGDIGARNATLTIMVGGPAPAYEQCLPLLQTVGKTITHVGPVGMGQVCKACNQIVGAGTLMGVCEAIALAQKSGLDPLTMIHVVSGGASASWQLANLGPKIVAQDFRPGFMINLMLKDLAIADANARAAGLQLQGLAAAQQYFQQVQQQPHGGDQGTQAMIQAISPPS